MLNRLEAEKDSLAPFCGCSVGRNVRKSNAVSGNSTGMAAKEQLPKYCSSQLQRYLSTCMVTPLCSADLFQDQWKKKNGACVFMGIHDSAQTSLYFTLKSFVGRPMFGSCLVYNLNTFPLEGYFFLCFLQSEHSQQKWTAHCSHSCLYNHFYTVKTEAAKIGNFETS